ncbi:YdcF family protein [Novosphingobium cyanobacteriorum]|uniref:YdcF family protein n=1 Tax=Novosphingobium cyanobacteriorum TaxID=3024215 RepID=A0ABT6CG52_9SPHN|nr:YdcF family protein [Novosphingobium cyanobacteriorum]MDF8332070.1 YdcF family protein [Novosphingobium cyanobacteriorum]
MVRSLRKPPGLMRRIASFLLLAWVLGFLWFALTLPQPAGSTRTDGVVALTGAGGRIPRAIEVLRAGQARKMLVAGVDSEVRPGEFAAEYGVGPDLLSCCVTLGYESVDTRSNAQETARWIAAQRIQSVRLVTTDWHMRRAVFDLWLAGPNGLVIVEDAVRSRPSLKTLFIEYNKLLARMVAWAVGL